MEDLHYGVLFVVATPIGNLDDITFRAIDVLREVDVILAEDTRVTSKLLDKYEISAKKLLSYHHHSQERKKLEILNFLLSGKKVALVTDAGTPGISDPGNELISFLLDNADGIKVVPVPGASAVTTALSVSGMNINKFIFLGFLPKKKRTKLFQWIKEGGMPFAFYESPKRILSTLKTIKEEFGNTEVFVARELTKMHETLYRGRVGSIISELEKDIVRGEVVVVVALK